MPKAACSHPLVGVTRFLKFWLPVIIWMSLIFSASTNLGAPQNSSRIIGPFLHWLNPDISDKAVETVQFLVRKSCHAIEYAILALLLWRARRHTTTRVSTGWSWREAQFAILICALYASTDEFHQYFVSTRQASVWDVLLDTTGAVVGIFALWLFGRWKKYW